MKSFAFLFALIFSNTSSAQQYDADGFEIVNPGPSTEILEQIDDEYQSQIEPFFKDKCLSCHSVNNNLPWYSVIPGVSHLLDYDMREAKAKMDMSKGFPFTGHGSPRDDLRALSRVVGKDKMPPLRYQMMHWNSALTIHEKEVLNKWIDQSLSRLEN
ncbi:MAG: hypothetical protein CME71_06895 [Halobacteriovorax sp.]|nr:hypothetical protein [Halobacteriovorax sp.]|tara:strand:- start:1096 stop:1566 length:471 start_codon:yes stop_codon:yes gene_type:complete